MMRFKPKAILKLGIAIFVLLQLHQIYHALTKPPRDGTFDGIFLNSPRLIQEGNQTMVKIQHCVAKLPKNQDDLMEQFKWDRHWEWISTRVKTNWPHLQKAVGNLQNGTHAEEFANRTCLNVLILPGLLTITNFAQKSSTGGPLGELLQWADLISTLHALGHKLSLRYSIQYTGIDLRALRGEKSQNGCSSEEIDMIFTDLGGHSNLPHDIQQNYSNKIHILDAYGTEVMYNAAEYAKDHLLARSAGLRDLNIKHFLTMYPQTVDNSFIGFIVHPRKNFTEKQETAMLYGKEAKYLFGKEKFILTLRKYMEIHATMNRHIALMNLDVIENHGILSSEEYHKITNRNKYFIGLGDPVEGPGMLEALARGCVIIQPKFMPQRSMHNMGKPTNRNLSSQLPYLERIGKPHVYTIDYNDQEAVTDTINKLIGTKIKPLLPYEFSAEGYAHRMNTYLITENTCKKKTAVAQKLQPQVQLVVSKVPDMSCTRVCRSKGLICDVNQFPSVNKETILKTDSRCSNVSKIVFKSDIHSPAIEKTMCVLQGNEQLFSCASYTNEGVYRLCPCVKCDIHNRHFCPYNL